MNFDIKKKILGQIIGMCDDMEREPLKAIHEKKHPKPVAVMVEEEVEEPSASSVVAERLGKEDSEDEDMDMEALAKLYAALKDA